MRPRGGAILEWGSGITSFLLADFCAAYGSKRFVTMDTFRPYQEAVLKALPADVAVEGYTLDEKGPCLDQQDQGLNYSMYPLSLGLGSCDLVFIDGRRRMECLMAALPLCHEDTLILLHDYRRARYQLALTVCDLVEDNAQFRVLRINRHILARMAETRAGLLAGLTA